MFEGGSAASRRLPFHFQAHGGVGRLALGDLAVGPVTIDKLELEVSELGTDPAAAAAERFQRRRTRLRGLAVRVAQPALDERVAQVRSQLAGIGITQLAARLADGYVSVRARAADGLAAADLSFHVELASSGAQLRALAGAIRVHGHLPTPGPVIADRVLVALTGAGDAARTTERPYSRGLCDIELDLVGALLWQVLPPSGWRLPAVSDIELTHIQVARAAIEIAYGPTGARTGELGVPRHTHQLAATHDLMHSVDEQLRGGHLEDAMRGYRALLASGGPDQPVLLERILALAAARPAWFGGGLELARQALGRWPRFAPAHAALAAITLAQGDAREAARHLEDGARMAGAEGDDDQAALAALAAARLLRVLDPRAATQLYQLALEHDPGSAEAADSLADRLGDEQRWSELVRLVRGRIGMADPPRAVQLHLRLAAVFVHQLGDPAGAQRELTAARELAPDDPAVHEMTATILVASDPAGAIAAWREVARLAELRGAHRTCARAWARLGELFAAADGAPDGAAEDAWRRSLELDPLQADALIGLAAAAAERNDHAIAAELYERLRGLGLPQATAAHHELALARSLVALGRTDDARASLRRATLAGGEPAAEAHAMLAEIADATLDRDHAAAELDAAIASLIELATGTPLDGDRLSARAAELAVARATLLDRSGQPVAAGADWQRAHALAQQAAPEIARDAARTLLARSGDDAGLERRWIDAVLATRPPPAERAALLVRRADVRRRERSPDLAAALADLHEALELTEEAAELDGGEPEAGTDTRRRAYQLEAELFAQSGDQRSRAQALAAIARLAERAADRVASEAAAAAAWLAADEPAAALPHGARAHASLPAAADVPAALRREVLITLGEAAWRQRAWPDVVRAYRGLLDDPGPEAVRAATFRFRLAVAADRAGDSALALGALRPLADDPESTRGASPELRAHALRLFADLAERAGELDTAATALEAFAAIGGDGSAPARADAMYRAGELFRRSERDDDAIRCYEAALRISDSHLPALDALEAAWRERGDLERVAVILGRKVAATARHPARQKSLLSRLGDLQDQLHRPEVALATHQRALEIDPMWRPSLRYVTLRLRDSGQVVAAAGGLAQLVGELHGDHGIDLAIATRERQIAAEALSELVARLDDAQLEAVRPVALPALERAALDNAGVGAGLARLRGETAAAVVTAHSEADTQSGRVAAPGGALSLREAAARARAAGKLDDAFATLETANHVSPGDVTVLRELVEIATELHDHTAAARHLAALALRLTGPRRADVLLELADVYYDRLDDAARGREAMRRAAEAFGAGARRDATLRLLATEAGTHLAWDIAVESLLAIPAEKRMQADFTSLATALMRAGRDADALAAIEAATAARRFDDGGELLRQIQLELQRKIDLARSLEDRAAVASAQDAAALLDEAQQLRIAIGQPGTQPLRDTAAPDGDAQKSDTAPWPVRTKTMPGLPNRQVPPAPAGARIRPGQQPPPGGFADANDGARSSPVIVIPDAHHGTRSQTAADAGKATRTTKRTGDTGRVTRRRFGVAAPDTGQQQSPHGQPTTDAGPSARSGQSPPVGQPTRSGQSPPVGQPTRSGQSPPVVGQPTRSGPSLADAGQATRRGLGVSVPEPRQPTRSGQSTPDADQPIPSGQSDADADQLLPVSQTDAETDQPIPSDHADAGEPLPVSQTDADADRPIPSDHADAGEPLPVSQTDADAGRPIPSDHADAGRPIPSDHADAGRPIPSDHADADAGRPIPSDHADAGAGRPIPSDHADADRPIPSDHADADRPIPVSQTDADAGRPVPSDHADADRPIPVSQTDADAGRPVPSDHADADRPIPSDHADAGRPIPSDHADADQPIPSDHLDRLRHRSQNTVHTDGSPPSGQTTADTGQPTRSSPIAVPEMGDAGAPASGVPEIAHGAPGASEDAGGEPRGDGDLGAGRARSVPDAARRPTPPQIAPRPPAPSAAGQPGEAEPARSPSPGPISQSTLGRIKLVSRVVTRPGAGGPRSDAPASGPPPVREVEDASEDWQSVSNPELKSGPWLPPIPRPSGSSRPAPSVPPQAHPAGGPEPALPAVPPPPRTSVPEPPALRAAPAPSPSAPPASGSPIPPAPTTGGSASEPSAAPGDTSRLSPPAPARPTSPASPGSGLAPDPAVADPERATPSVTITGTPEETALALLLAAASADRERLFAARRADPDDPAVLLALLAHLGDREPAIRRELLDEAVRTSHGRALAIALHELAVLAREGREQVRATALWTRAYDTDPSYPPVWMPLADALAAADDHAAARELYDAIARSDAYDSTRRAFASGRAEALGRDDSIVSGELEARGAADLEEARLLAASEDWPGAIDAAERAAAARPDDVAILEVLETIYFASGNVTAASEAIGRQLTRVDDPALRAALWRRRARMYRDALGRDAEAYRCLQEAHACSPADPEIAYQLRTAAMVRGEWQLAASLMHREIAAAANPRDRGALHLELAMILEERLDDPAGAQANYEQALAFDPTIPAVKLPLARRYEAIGRPVDAARLYEEAAGHARPADRAGLLEAAARCRQAAAEAAEPDLAAQLDRAEATGDLDAALELAGQLWRAEPGHPAAFRTLASGHRASGDLAALTELTRVRAKRAETGDERATAWLEVARLAEEVGALDQAARAYDLALIEDPGHLGALDARGALAFRIADFATADLIYRDLGSGESVLGDDELALRRSIIAEQLGRDGEALQLAQIAASLAPGRRDVVMRVQELATRSGELTIALDAARSALELIPLDDDEAQLATQFTLVELLRETGRLDDAVAQLERILRDHPMHAGAIEALAQVHTARGDWTAATRYLYQLVPLAPSPGHRAERLYQLGEAVLVHVNDIDRADDVFLRASDLDPGHVPTLRRLLDVYWRADDPSGIVEVATELAAKGALISGPTAQAALARALIAAALVGDIELAQQLQTALGEAAPRQIAEALAELAGRTGRLQLGAASTAIADLARRGFLDLAKLRAATAGTPAANTL